MPLLADLQAVLFDMDGTLVDSDAAVVRAWGRWAQERGALERLAGVDLHGRPAEGTIRLLFPSYDDDAVARAAASEMALQYDDLDDVVALPGADRLLAALDRRRLPWAIVTSADRRLAAARLGAAGIPSPPVLVTVEDVSAGKPDPEGYELAAARLAVPIERTLVVEDSEAGLQAGRAAGARTAALRGLDGDLRIAGLDDLARLLEAREAGEAA
jgi:mannitol-1-/sugar-/sorbitol-6-phosphatase